MREMTTPEITHAGRRAQYERGLRYVKLTKEQAEEIRELLATRGASWQEMQERYGISKNILHRIKNNLAYTEQNPTWLKALPFFGQKPTKE